VDDSVYPQSVIGFRAWTISQDPQTGHDRLASLWLTSHWTPGVNHATCALRSRAYSITHAGGAPDKACACGLYATHDVALALGHVPSDPPPRRCLIGSVALRGRVLVHRDGVRGAEACVTALALPSPTPDPGDILWARTLADNYNVPLVNICDLEREGLRYGTTAPQDVRPPAYVGPCVNSLLHDQEHRIRSWAELADKSQSMSADCLRYAACECALSLLVIARRPRFSKPVASLLAAAAYTDLHRAIKGRNLTARYRAVLEGLGAVSSPRR
jgi:hypothetical protein